MNRNELIDAIALRSTAYREAGLTKTQINACLNALGDVAMIELSTEEGEVPLPLLGKLKASVRAGRTGRNPKTGEPVEIGPKNVVKFSPAKVLKDALA